MARRNVACKGTILNFGGVIANATSFSIDDTGNEIDVTDLTSDVEEVIIDIGTRNVEWEVLGTSSIARGTVASLTITLPDGVTKGPYANMICTKNSQSGSVKGARKSSLSFKPTPAS
jgi:hypothetical protein